MTDIPCAAATDDPQPDRPGTTAPAHGMPERIAALLHTVGIILGFGRHLAATAQRRAATPSFNTIAACFGTSRLSTILAHLQRGILLATAMQNVLRARAARGRDIDFVQRHQRSAAAPIALAELTAGQPAGPGGESPAAPVADEPAVRKPARAPSRPAGWNDPELFIPSLKQLEAQVRRRPLGCTLVAICLDLGVLPGLCTSAFWNQLHEDICLYGGSVVPLMQEKRRREDAFSQEQDRKPQSNWDWVQQSREAVRGILGRFIGEAADGDFDPMSQSYAPAAAAPAGPS